MILLVKFFSFKVDKKLTRTCMYKRALMRSLTQSMRSMLNRHVQTHVSPKWRQPCFARLNTLWFICQSYGWIIICKISKKVAHLMVSPKTIACYCFTWIMETKIEGWINNNIKNKLRRITKEKKDKICQH